jgi:hypothetical protein
VEIGPYDWDYHQLGYALAHFDGEGLAAAVPARYEHLSLVVGIDQTYQVAEHYAVLMTEPGTGDNYGRKPCIFDVNGYTGWNKLSIPRHEGEVLFQASPQIQSGRSAGGVFG